MAEFVCKVGDTAGRISQQLETAQSEAEARQKLGERGFYVYSVRNHFDIVGQFTRARNDRKIRQDDFLIFNQQFNTLVKAGLPILKALDLLAERAASQRLRPILIEVRDRVRNGAMLSEAMEAQGAFPPVYVTVISAGERSGNLSGVLDQYISYLRTSTGFRNRLITTMIYPTVLVSFAVLRGDVFHHVCASAVRVALQRAGRAVARRHANSAESCVAIAKLFHRHDRRIHIGRAYWFSCGPARTPARWRLTGSNQKSQSWAISG